MGEADDCRSGGLSRLATAALITAFVALLRGGAARYPALDVRSDANVVQKAAVSSELRLVFAVGLEGAGEHVSGTQAPSGR